MPRLHRRAPVTLALDGLDPRPAGESSEPDPELPLDEAGALGTDSPGPPPPRKKVNVRPSVGGSALDQYLYLEDLSEPYWRRNLRVQYVTSWPVGTPEANPKVGGTKSFGNIEFFRGLRDDLKRKSKCYPSDWLDGLRSGKSIAAIAFLYFACLAPVVAFGGALSSLTQGAMGVVEVLLSCGLCGMGYATIAGQPMTFVAPTGLTLAFTAALYRYCVSLAVPFLPMYSWVGCWTALLLVGASTINASGLIRYCTRFTEDVFNALLAFNFLSEACRSLANEFSVAATPGDGLLALNMAALTAFLLQQCTAFRSKRYLTAGVRESISDFGPPAVIMGLSAISLLPAMRALGTFSRISMPGGFMLSGGRPLVVNMLALPVAYRWLAFLPAIFLATLFFLDQNITVRTVNSASHKLRKGAAYHLDLCALGLLTLFSSLLGLPWMCSATVQSLNHIRAMTIYKKSTSKEGGEAETAESVVETRLTGFGVHAAILSSALVVPLISCVPLPVVAGVFLYLGRKVMAGNQFLRRCKQLFIPEEELCTKTVGEKEQVILGKATVLRFTAIQCLCLTALWALKLSPSTALIFPSVIGVLMFLRVKLIPKIFSSSELMLLDTPIGATIA